MNKIDDKIQKQHIETNNGKKRNKRNNIQKQTMAIAVKMNRNNISKVHLNCT